MRLILAGILFITNICYASETMKVSIAVASNALKAMQVIKKEFEKNTSYQLVISSGSTGKLYAQIINGAPYDVFLAANVREPLRLESDNAIVKGSRFTYARGRLALCSTKIDLDELTSKQRLTTGGFQRLALASPKTAPYGIASKEVLEKMGAWKTNRIKYIQGENISQAYQFTASGNVDAGFVALAQVWGKTKTGLKKCWNVPEEYHSLLEQQAVWLKRSSNNIAASAFIRFLKSKKAKEILRADFGYGV